MTAARKAARGQPCDLQFPGVCNQDWSTTVLAHIRRPWNAGGGMKPPDEHGVYACHKCHRALDREDPYEHLSREDINRRVVRAVLRRNGVPSSDEWGYVLDAVLQKVIR